MTRLNQTCEWLCPYHLPWLLDEPCHTYCACHTPWRQAFHADLSVFSNVRHDLPISVNEHAPTGWRRPIGCLVFIGHFPQKSPIISGSFAETDLQIKAFNAFLSPCIIYPVQWVSHVTHIALTIYPDGRHFMRISSVFSHACHDSSITVHEYAPIIYLV